MVECVGHKWRNSLYWNARTGVVVTDAPIGRKTYHAIEVKWVECEPPAQQCITLGEGRNIVESVEFGVCVQYSKIQNLDIWMLSCHALPMLK